MYADTVTKSMQACIEVTSRRRQIQQEYNSAHGITPASVKKQIRAILQSVEEHDYVTVPLAAESAEEYVTVKDIPKLVKKLRKEMLAAAKALDFEKAAGLRDRVRKLEDQELKLR